MDAGHIAQLLAVRHSENVFVTQCKDGPTQGGLAQLDAWVMVKSWTQPKMIGYEIKVSRQDFLHDNKWSKYLKMCNELYFVCPWDIIHINEVPADCGLMWVSKSGTMVTTKKKAPYRRIEEPVDLMKYLLMARATIDKKYQKLSHGNGHNKEYWEGWLADKDKNWHFGNNLRKSLRAEIKKKIIDVDNENKHLQSRISDYNEIAQVIKSLGMDPVNFSTHQVTDAIRDLKKIVPDVFVWDFNRLCKSLDDFKTELKKLGVKI
jgi:hypothetical protein